MSQSQQSHCTPASQQPAAPTFFNFGNDETFLFFKWVCEGGEVDLQAMIDEAIREDKEGRRANDPPGLSDEVLDHLAGKLKGPLREMEQRVVLASHALLRAFKQQPASDAHPEHVAPQVLARINLRRVAEALLFRAGKWEPTENRLAGLARTAAPA